MRVFALMLVTVLWACTSGNGADAGDAAADAADTNSARDVAADVGPVDPCGPSPCGAEELCGPVINGVPGAGNGADDDCDGLVDEGCPCAQFAAESCFPGPPDHRGIGACHDGTSVCSELGIWGDCHDPVVPSPEICDGIDNDCDGRADEDLVGCMPSLRCPAYDTAQPLADYRADGLAIDPGASGFHWTLECPADVSTCPTPVDASATSLRVRLVQSGTYVIHVEITRSDGTVGSCRYPLYVRGQGLRVELDWDTKGGIGAPGTDLDLHAVTLDRTRTFVPAWFTSVDCYYATCVAPGARVFWTTAAADPRFAANTDVEACAGAPAPYGDAWRASGRCWNPRLDADDLQCDPSVTNPADPTFCFVENINVDVAPDDVTFRLMVNYYEDHGTCGDALSANDVTHPNVRVFCGGVLRAVLGGGEQPVSMPCALNAERGSENFSWLAADVRFFTNACGVQDCDVAELHASATTATPSCDALGADQDVCVDGSSRLFVRRAGGRPVEADVGNTFPF